MAKPLSQNKQIGIAILLVTIVAWLVFSYLEGSRRIAEATEAIQHHCEVISNIETPGHWALTLHGMDYVYGERLVCQSCDNGESCSFE